MGIPRPSSSKESLNGVMLGKPFLRENLSHSTTYDDCKYRSITSCHITLVTWADQMGSLRGVLRFFLITSLTTDGEVLHISKDMNENTDNVIADSGDLIT